MRFAKVLGAVGRVLIWSGTLVLLFVAYQLWGTNLAEARAQNDLEDSFTAQLEAHGTPTTDATTTTTSSTTTAPSPTTTRPTTTTTTEPPPPPVEGEAVGRIMIPKIGVDKFVVEGVSRSDLQKGPGHYPNTPMPGQPGNAAIAGHRTTYGAPFNRIDELDQGDEIVVDTLQGRFHYEVIGTQIVRPDQVDVVDDQGDDRLTLTSCHPKYSARQRIVVSARLVTDPAPSTTTTTTTAPPRDELPSEDVSPPTTALESLDAGHTRTAGPAVLWGSITAAVWLAFYVLSRRWRRWPAYLLGAPVFLVCLFVFFESFSELLPANF